MSAVPLFRVPGVPGVPVSWFMTSMLGIGAAIAGSTGVG